MQDKGKKKKRILTLKNLFIALAVLAVVYAVAFVFDFTRYDPNYQMLYLTRKVKLDETTTLKYRSSRIYISTRSSIPALCFQPEENTSYTFTISNIKSDDGIHLTLNVMDDRLSDYVYDDDLTNENNDDSNTDNVISGSALLNKSRKYYVIIDIVEDTKHDSYSGSFDFTVTKTPEDEGPVEIKADETISVKVDQDENTIILFSPEETSYYLFDSVLTGKGAKTGTSGITSIISDSGKEIKAYGGMSYLNAGTDYYISISADIAGKKTVDADVSCSKIEEVDADGHGTFDVSGETVIEYTSTASEITALWSESEGDPYAIVFDSEGLPINNDNDSGITFSRNRKDFALVFQAEKDEKYYIFIGGEFDKCSVKIAKYTGDGTKLGPGSVQFENEEVSGDQGGSIAEESESDTALDSE